MSALLDHQKRRAPTSWSRPVLGPGSGLHQLAPYIGKLKVTIAEDLVRRFTAPGDVVLDCFAGSGTIPLAASLLGRSTIAADRSDYAVMLTRAKLEAPHCVADALKRAQSLLKRARRRSAATATSAPDWVARFFHEDTLREAISFADECLEADEPFFLACLLGILHHQRPGFLSFPSSHLVPYLRDKRFPRSQFPELYSRRELEPRLTAKVRRALKRPADWGRAGRSYVYHADIAQLDLNEDVDAIITSPPYMNALDYVRDNRLRMWFLDRSTCDYTPEPTDRKDEFSTLCTALAARALSRLRAGGVCVLVVGETVNRKRMTSHPAERLVAALLAEDSRLTVEEVIEDDIPDVRRSRRSASGTKRELIVVLRKQRARAARRPTPRVAPPACAT